MSRGEKYNPQHAIEDPETYYDMAFENYARPWLVPLVGRAAVIATKPTLTFHESMDEASYFEKIEPDSSLVLTFTHSGVKDMHDPIAGIVAVFGTQALRERVSNTKEWVAVPYLTNPKFRLIIERLGSVPVIRSKDYGKFGVEPTNNEVLSVRNALIDRTARHLETPSSVLAAFPAGTKGGTKLREGVGLVLERLSKATVIPIATNSDTQSSGQIPRNLRIAYGRPIVTQEGIPSTDYVQMIDEDLQEAARLIA